MERIDLDDLFDRRLTFPDPMARKRLERLVGIDGARTRLTNLLSVLVNPDGLRAWARKHHDGAATVVDLVESRPPLAVLAGDVGTGKTELAETVGDAVARQEGIEVTLYPLSLSTRGSGRVGEMTKLLGAAFDETVAAAKRLRRTGPRAGGAVILLVDEADALAQSRDTEQMHHEDRAGVNAFIRGVDRLVEQRLPAAVIMCTNRLGAIDPAVRRRAAEIFEFVRPDETQRRTVMQPALEALGLTKEQVDQIVELTGPRNGRLLGFTYSDLTQRLIPTLVLDAYPELPVTYDRALSVVKGLNPTPPFGGISGGAL